MARELALPRETAEDATVPREVAAEERTFTEGETYALVADNVARETASLQAEKAGLETQVATLTAEKAELQNRLDTETARAEKAEQDFEAYKADEVRKAELAELAGTRTKAVREVAKHLKDDFFTPERAERWAAMDQADFDTYLAEMAAASAGAGEPKPGAETAALDSTAMSGEQPAAPKGGAAFFDFLGRGN
jgi:septal ring factor EnvC (AmiA/AmiB activator)